MDLLLGQKSSLSLSGNVVYTPYWKRSTEATTEAFDNANQLDSLFNSLNLTKDDKINANLSVGYDHQGEKERNSLYCYIIPIMMEIVLRM